MTDGSTQTFWVDGEPYTYLISPDEPTGKGSTYWADGSPMPMLIADPPPPPAEVTGLQEKTFMALFF